MTNGSGAPTTIAQERRRRTVGVKSAAKHRHDFISDEAENNRRGRDAPMWPGYHLPASIEDTRRTRNEKYR